MDWNRRVRRDSERHLVLDSRKINLERRSVARLAIDPDVSAALFDDSVDRRQAEARALPFFLGGEERLEDVGLRLFVHAAAVVGDRQHDVLAGRQRNRRMGSRGVEFDVAGFDREAPALRHGVARIDRKIHDHLLDLAAVGLYEPEIGCVDVTSSISSPIRRRSIFSISATTLAC